MLEETHVDVQFIDVNRFDPLPLSDYRDAKILRWRRQSRAFLLRSSSIGDGSRSGGLLRFVFVHDVRGGPAPTFYLHPSMQSTWFDDLVRTRSQSKFATPSGIASSAAWRLG